MVKLSFADFYTLVWSMVPAVWKEADDEYGKSLQVLLYTMSQHMYYYFYNRIVHMEELFDADRCPEKYLKFLSGIVGWKLVGNDPASWREQIKAAPLLYKVRGTKRGLLLAEKLVGYSIFMSELYRDHVGDAVPKERIFNNTPDSIKTKPWFRNTLTSLEGETLPGFMESDEFESYNSSGFVKLNSSGVVVRPRIVSTSRKIIFTKTSTTSRYNNITGKYSTARYAKLPRVNIVLKYDLELDAENEDGGIKQNNFSGALDLLLQFKPFHVYIENLEVRYSLSEFIFDQTNMSSESLNVHEQVEAAAYLESERIENTITFSPFDAVDTTPAVEIPADAIDNRGVIASVYKIIDLSTLTPSIETSLASVLNKSLPVKAFKTDGFTVSDIVLSADGDTLLTQEEYVAQVSSALPAPGPVTVTAIPVIIIQPVNSFTYTGQTTSVRLYCQSDSTNPEALTVEWYRNASLFWTDTSSLNKASTLIIDPVDNYSYTYYCKITNLAGTVSSNVVSISDIVPPVHGVLGYDISNFLSEPLLDFKAMLSSQYEDTTLTTETTDPTYQWTPENPPRLVNAADPYWSAGEFDALAASNKIVQSPYSVGCLSSEINSVYISPTPYRSVIDTDKTTFYKPGESSPTAVSSSQAITNTPTDSNPSRPWDLRSIQTFLDDPLRLSAVYHSAVEVFKQLHDTVMVLVLEISGDGYVELDNNIDYYFDSNNKIIYFNSLAICNKVTGMPDNYNFLTNSYLHAIYLTRTTYENETKLGIPNRGFRYINRENTKFSRQFNINSLPQDSLTRLMPTDIISVDGKTKQKTVLGVKQFKTTSTSYNRSSLRHEVIDSTYSVLNKDPLSRTDKSKWTVYSPEFTSYYLGDQKITNNWWGNYFQSKYPDISEGEPAFVPYEEVDVSGEAQLKNNQSDQWLSALKSYNISDPKQFLVTRKNDSARTGIWKRNSGKFISIPFIRSRRDALQVFRRDAPTFTRSEESTDYLVDTGVPPRLDNYKYILSDGTDVSLAYFSPGFSKVDEVSVTMDRAIGEKALISGYDLTFPGSDTYYDNFSTGLEASTYFTRQTNLEYNIKPSLYAGNIPVSKNPNLYAGITEQLDRLSLLITGLISIVDNFEVPATATNEFILSQSNLFVNWVEINTGDIVAFGYYPPYYTSVVAAPNNIRVFLNGILLTYNDQWSLIFDKLKTVIISDSILLDEFDTIRVEYNVIPGQNDVISMPPDPQIPKVLEFTLEASDISLIKEGNRHIFNIPVQTDPATLTNIPCISWYSRVTGGYINSGSTPLEYQPYALYEDAEPNVTIRLNGIPIKYKKDWLFLLKMENDILTPSVAISPELSMSLASNDTIRFEYFTTT